MKVVIEGRSLLKLLKQVAGVASKGIFAGQPGLARLTLPEGRAVLLAEAWDGVLGVRVWVDVGFPTLRGPAPRQVEVEAPSFIWDAGHRLVRSEERPRAPIEAEPGQVVVPVAMLAGLLAGYEDRWVQLHAGDAGLVVRILPPLDLEGRPERERGGQWRIACPSASAWSDVLYVRHDDPSLLPAAVVVRLGQATDFVSKAKGSQGPVHGVRLILGRHRARVHATDGHVLAVMDMSDPSIVADARMPASGVVFDVSGLSLLASLAGGCRDAIELHVQSSGVVVAAWGDSMVSLPVLAGVYPPVETAMPAALAMEATVSPRDLSAALQRCELLRSAGEPAAAVLSSAGHVVGKTNLVITMVGGELGEAEEVLPAGDFTGPADVGQRPRIKFLGGHLVRLLKLVEGQAVICLQSPDASGFTKAMALVRDTARPDFLGGLMPMVPSPHA